MTIAPEPSQATLRTPARPFRKLAVQIIVTLGFCTTLTGCFNGESEIDLGSVSVGQQLIDLKKARDSKSMTEEEYQSAKKSILLLLNDISDLDDDDIRIEIDIEDDEDEGKGEKEEEESSGFLF